MKKVRLVMLVLFAAFVGFQGVAMAALVSGTVDAVDTTAQSVTIKTMNVATGAEETVTVSVTEATTFAGAADLTALQVGDQVEVMAEENPAAPSGWQAASIEVQGAEEAEAEAPAAQ